MISAFKHIRLSGFNLLPQSSNGNVRLSLNSSGVAYFNELSTASGVLNTKINAFSGTFQSFVNNLDNTFATDAQLSAASGVLQSGINTVATNLASTGAANLGRINTLSGNVGAVSGFLQTGINTVATNLASTGSTLNARINSLSGTFTGEFVRKATQQQFIVTLPISVESTGITFPVAFASIPNSVQATFEPSTDVGYMVAIRNRTTAGFTAEFSDVLFESGNKLNVFASI